MSIFPFIDGKVSQTSSMAIKIPKEYSWEVPGDEFIFKDGRFKVVEGIEAIKIWVYKAMKTQRYRFLAYSWNYGNETESLIGSQISNQAIQGEAKRHIEEALLINPYIKSVKDIALQMDEDKLMAEFTIVTTLGEARISV